MEWLAKQCEATYRRAIAAKVAAAAEVSIPVHNKGKRKIVDHMEEEKSCKFRVYPLVEKAAMAIEEKRQQHNK